MKMCVDPVSKLVLPEAFIDSKQSLKASINALVEDVKNQMGRVDYNYFLTIHAKFHGDTFTIDAPKITKKLPPFLSNTFVYWISNKKGICELLWMVPPKKKGEKLQVRFNKNGVAYLQAKGAMPS